MILFFILPSNSSVLYIPCTVYGNWNIKAFLTPTTSKCKNQAVYLLFWGGSWREKKKKKHWNCAHIGGNGVVTLENHAEMRATFPADGGNEGCAFSWGGDASGVEVATHALVLHAKWMPHIQQPDIGRLMRSVKPPPPLRRVSSTQHGPRGNHVLHQSLRLHLLLLKSLASPHGYLCKS